MPSGAVRAAGTSAAPSPGQVIAVAAMVGAAFGGAAELGFQPIVHLRDAQDAADLPFPLLQLLIVPLISATLFGAVGGLAALPVAWLPGRRARAVGLAFVGLVLAIALGIHGVGFAVRYVSGLYPSSSAAMLLIDSPVQFLDHALESFPNVLPWIVVGLLATWASITVSLGLVLRRAERWGKSLLAAPATAFVGAAMLGTPFVSTGLRDRALENTELSLYASILEALAEEDAGGLRHEALDGPPQTEGGAYMAALGARAGEPFPNVLLIMLESVPQSGTGFGGYRARAVTPNLDRLAAESLRFRRAWATATHSNYAQMAVLSSLLPRRGNHLDVYRVLDYPRTMPQDLLHPLGFDTATFSSQDESWQGMRRFEATPTPHVFFESRTFRGPKHGVKVPDDETVTAALSWLERPRQGPFYLYLNLQTTHYGYSLPGDAPPRFAGPTIEDLRASGHQVSFMLVHEGAREAVRLAFDNALHFVDAQIGRLLDALRATGELDDTLVVVTADHGESFGEGGIDTHGKTLREPEARPPLFFYFPKRIAAGDVDVPVSHLDVMPTVLDALGLPPYPGHQGASVLDPQAFARERRAVFLTMQGLRHSDAVVCFPWKLVHDRSMRRFELYHLLRDPGERRNIVAIRPDVSKKLEELLATQIAWQLAFHGPSREAREQRFAPRIARCPELPR